MRGRTASRSGAVRSLAVEIAEDTHCAHLSISTPTNRMIPRFTSVLEADKRMWRPHGALAAETSNVVVVDVVVVGVASEERHTGAVGTNF